jgi:hypothetical protein
MSPFVQCSIALAVLVSTGHAIAQSGEPDQDPPRSVTFDVVSPTFEGQPDAPAAGTHTEETRNDNRMHNQFFVPSDGSRAPPLQVPQRAALRASLEQQYPDLAEGIGVDAQTAGKLLDLLAEHQRERFERGGQDAQNAPTEWVLQEAEAESKRLAALHDLLGEAAMARYLDYAATARERFQVRALDARLPPEHKLLPEQKQRLIALYQEDDARTSELDERRHSAARRPFVPGEDLQRASRLATIAANEEHLQTMAHSQQWMSERAAQFLTAPQLAALSQLHTEERTSLQRWIERARVDAGLEPTIAHHELQTRQLISGAQVSVEIELTVDREEPLAIDRVMTVGESVTIDAGKGVFVQAKPRLYEDGEPTVRLEYYEQQQGGRRRPLTSISMISNMLMRDGGEAIGTETFVVASGLKAYAIRAKVRVAEL